jgi:hypothetical protein
MTPTDKMIEDGARAIQSVACDYHLKMVNALV